MTERFRNSDRSRGTLDSAIAIICMAVVGLAAMWQIVRVERRCNEHVAALEVELEHAREHARNLARELDDCRGMVNP